MLKGQVVVTLKKSILDPQGSAVEKALSGMGHPVAGVRIGKFMEVELGESDPVKARAVMDEICYKVLSNPVIEDYRYELFDEQGNPVK